MKKKAYSGEPLYLRVAHLIEAQIHAGGLRVGDRIPSIRSFSRQQKVSVSTTLQAYFWLENRGYVEARNKSGFYVRVPLEDLAPEPKFRTADPGPSEVGVGDVLMKVVRAMGDPGMVPLGAACPAPALQPHHKLNRITRSHRPQRPLTQQLLSISPRLGIVAPSDCPPFARFWL